MDTSAGVSRSQSHKTRAFRDGGASADVLCRHGLRLQDAPPLECCVRSDELTVPIRSISVCSHELLCLECSRAPAWTSRSP